MSYILDLRGRLFHAGIPLVHPSSEHVVLANVFGIVKNLSVDSALNPWLERTTGNSKLHSRRWQFSFWEKQHRPVGLIEGNTEVDLVLDSEAWLIFVEAKMNAEASRGTRANPDRNQLVRNLDVGYRRAKEENKGFALIYVTPELQEPEIVRRIRCAANAFPANSGVASQHLLACLHWSSWGGIGDVLAESSAANRLSAPERAFVLDILAYLSQKRLWKNTLADDELFYRDKLYRSLQKGESPFLPYSQQRPETYQGWRTKAWSADELRSYLVTLRAEDRALLKLLADAGGALQQHTIMETLPFLRGRTSASLRALKAHINAGCKQLDHSPILSEGSGSGDYRVHEINRDLGELRKLVIEIPQGFVIDWHLLERGVPAETRNPLKSNPERTHSIGRNRAWYVVSDGGRRDILAFVDAKGSCSCRMFDYDTGRFVRRYANQRGSFRNAFASLFANGAQFSPPSQPDLVSAENTGLPQSVLQAAKRTDRMQ
jgi:hypothetical protein